MQCFWCLRINFIKSKSNKSASYLIKADSHPTDRVIPVLFFYLVCLSTFKIFGFPNHFFRLVFKTFFCHSSFTNFLWQRNFSDLFGRIEMNCRINCRWHFPLTRSRFNSVLKKLFSNLQKNARISEMIRLKTLLF